MSSYEFETHEPVDLYVELGKGEVEVTASDTTATTVEVEGRDAERVEVRQDGRQISVIGPKGNRGGGSSAASRRTPSRSASRSTATPSSRRAAPTSPSTARSARARSRAAPATAGSTPSTAR